MFKELRAFLKNIIPSEQVEIYIRSMETLNNHYGQSVVMLSEDLIRTARDNDTTIVVNHLRDIILEKTTEALKSYGIFIDEAYVDYQQIEPLTNILAGIIETESYEDKQYILNILESREDDLEGILTVIATVMDIDKMSLDNLVSRVNSNLIDKIITLFTESVRETDIEEYQTMIHPSLIKFMELDYAQYVDKLIITTITQPYKLSIQSLLRSFGNRVADDKTGHYSWLYLLLMASESIETVSLDTLFNVWDSYFLEETNKLEITPNLIKIFNTVKIEDEVTDA